MSRVKAALIDLPYFSNNTGNLTVLESNNQVPFSIQRVFIVQANRGEIRGKHAHRLCTQLMICSSGSIEVIVNNGENEESYLLDSPNKGLMVHSTLWAQETYKEDGSVLTVLCDMKYDPDDYIHELDEFMKIYGENSGRKDNPR